MRNQEEWARKLRSRMENHQEPAPSDIWDNIDKALGNNTKAKTIPLWRWMAAACAAAVAIATWMVMGNNITTGFEPDRPFHVVDIIVDAVKAGKITPERLKQSYDRIRALKNKLPKADTGTFIF